MVVPPGDSIQTDFSHSTYQKCCDPGPIICDPEFERLDTPDGAINTVIGQHGEEAFKD